MPEEQNVEDPLNKFRSTLKHKREELGLKIAPAARRAGMAPNTWTFVEQGYQKKGEAVIPYRPTRDFVIKAVRALGNWDLAEALTLAGHRPERLAIDDSMAPQTGILSLWGRLSRQQQQALEWTMRLMLDKHAAMTGAPAPPPDPGRPVFTDEPQSSRSRL